MVFFHYSKRYNSAMKKCAISRSRRYGPTKKAVLVLSLTGIAVVVTLPVFWAYEKVNLGVGTEAAQITKSRLSVSIFILHFIRIHLHLLPPSMVHQQVSCQGILALLPLPWYRISTHHYLHIYRSSIFLPDRQGCLS